MQKEILYFYEIIKAVKIKLGIQQKILKQKFRYIFINVILDVLIN